MNAGKLSDAIGELDDRYIDEAAGYKKKKSRTILIKLAAMAACLCLAVYAAAALSREAPITDEYGELPMLSAQFDSMGMGFEGLLLYDVSESGSDNPWNEDMRLKTLPVYENLACADGAGETVYLSEEEMLAIAEDIVERLGAEIIDTKYYTAYSGEGVHLMRADTDEHTVSVSGNGSVVVTFNSQDEIFSGYTTDSEAKELIAGLLQKYSSLIQLENPVACTWCDYSFDGRQSRRFFVYEDASDTIQKILNYNFGQINLTLSGDGDELFAVSFGSGLSYTNKIGDYPIITADEARKMLLRGEYISSVPDSYLGASGICEEKIAKVELVYRTERTSEVFIPYYRYYVELDPDMFGEATADGRKSYGAYYVPAVSGEYLNDFPLYDGRFNY